MLPYSYSYCAGILFISYHKHACDQGTLQLILPCIDNIPYGTNVWRCKILTNGATCDFDEENFDECCCLPVKHVLIIFLLLLHACTFCRYRCSALRCTRVSRNGVFLFHFAIVNCCTWLSCLSRQLGAWYWKPLLCRLHP